MADPPRDPDTGDDSRVEFDRGAKSGTTRWQIVVGIIGLLAILWVASRMLGTLLGHGHGDGGMRHGPREDGPPAEIQEQETDTGAGGVHEPPAGFH